MEQGEIAKEAEVTKVTAGVEDILQNKLGEGDYPQLKRLRGRVSTSPLRVDAKVTPKDFSNYCATICAEVQMLSTETKLTMSQSEAEGSYIHIYLTTSAEENGEIIVDPSIGQFLEGHLNAFVGTRDQLREIFVNQTGEGKPYKLINTEKEDNPEQVFQKIYGEHGRPYGNG